MSFFPMDVKSIQNDYNRINRCNNLDRKARLAFQRGFGLQRTTNMNWVTGPCPASSEEDEHASRHDG